MRRSTITVPVAALAVAVLTACGSSSPDVTPQAGRHGGSATSATPKAGAPSATGTPAPGQPGSTPGTTTSSAVPGQSAKPGTPAPGSGRGASATPAPQSTGMNQFKGTPEEVPIDASLSPTCVPAGGTVTLTVKTVKSAAIAFVAVYSDGKSGAEPPWGEGYGGNSKGNADFRGQWSSTWVVSPTAPRGDGHVMVVVGTKGKQRSINVPFSVGEREVGGCGT